MTEPTYRATQITLKNGRPVPVPGGTIHTGMPLEQVARLVEVDEDDIVWALEEEGEAFTDVWQVEEEA